MGLLDWQLVRVRGTSMRPALDHGTWVIVSRAAFRRDPPRRFDVVRLADPRRPGAWAIKRVAGLPGEELILGPAGLFIDGEMVAEPHIPAANRAAFRRWQVGLHQCFVLGDNRDHSTDSRNYGPVALTSLTGRVTRVLGKNFGLLLLA
ncbi:MAG: signal peptidase I [Acidobacteria bacterium]|nr:signal peptidase I [Acidobacteriota bacterium]